MQVVFTKIIEDFKKLGPAFKLVQQTDRNDLHQYILNLGYNWWQTDAPSQTSYGDMITYMIDTYGEFAASMVLVGKLNQQVENGGYSQYYDNGYADGDGGCLKVHNPEHPLHLEMIQFIEYFYNNYFINILEESDKILIEEFLRIQKRFTNLSIETDEEYEEDEYDEETGEHYTEMISNPEYGSFIDHAQVSKLNDEYYKISVELIKTWEKLTQVVYNIVK
jgi:hypothetical protein